VLETGAVQKCAEVPDYKKEKGGKGSLRRDNPVAGEAVSGGGGPDEEIFFGAHVGRAGEGAIKGCHAGKAIGVS